MNIIRYPLSLLLASLILSEVAFAFGRDENFKISSTSKQTEHTRDSFLNSEEILRSLYEFDQDDLFLAHTTEGEYSFVY